MRKGVRNDALQVISFLMAGHGVGLAGAGLSICEDGAIVAVEDFVHDG